MIVQVKLYGTLNAYRSAEQWGQDVPIKLEKGGNLANLLGKLGIPTEEAMLLEVNGQLREAGTPVREGDRVVIYPAMVGPVE